MKEKNEISPAGNSRAGSTTRAIGKIEMILGAGLLVAGAGGFFLNEFESEILSTGISAEFYYNSFNSFCIKNQKYLLEYGGVKTILGYALDRLGMALYINANSNRKNISSEEEK